MAYLRSQDPSRSRPPALNSDDDGFDLGRAQTPAMDQYLGRRNEFIHIPYSSPGSASHFRSQRETASVGRVNEERGSGDSRLRTLAERQPQLQLQPQPQRPTRQAPPAPRPNPLPRGQRDSDGSRAVEAPRPSVPAPAPRVDWRESEWMAQYQAQAEEDPFAKFYGN